MCHWKNGVDEVRRLSETMATYPYFHFWEAGKKGQDVENSPSQNFKMEHIIIWGFEKNIVTFM